MSEAMVRQGVMGLASGLDSFRLSTVVMAHPRRRENAVRIQRALPEMDIKIIFDPDPDGPPATLRTARAAWEAVSEDATHHLVLQDDVLPCRGFAESVRNAVQTAPPGAIALFATWSMVTAQAVRLASLAGASWTRLVDDWTPTQALILPARYAREFGAYAADLDDWQPDNRVMHAFLAANGVQTHVSIPCLVEHAEAKSLLINDLLHGVRNAVVFPAEHDMSTRALTRRVAVMPALSHMWMGAGEFYSAYDPIGTSGRAMVTPTHEVLEQFGVSHRDMTMAFAEDRERHPELAKYRLVGECFHFSMWLTMFASGIIAASLFDEPPPSLLGARSKQQWATESILTFPASALRKMSSHRSIHTAARHLAPFCWTGLDRGVKALRRWPALVALWDPGRHEIRPRWAL